MSTCRYRDDSALERAFGPYAMTDVEAVSRLLEAAIVLECREKIPSTAIGEEDRTWVTPMDGGGAAVVQIVCDGSPDNLSLSVKALTKHRHHAENLFNRILERAKELEANEADGPATESPSVALFRDATDDLPF